MDEKETRKLINGVLTDLENRIRELEGDRDRKRREYEARGMENPAAVAELEGMERRIEALRDHYWSIKEPFHNIGREVTIHLQEYHVDILRNIMRAQNFRTSEEACLWAIEQAPEELEE